MAKLGTKQKPLVVRVQTEEHAKEILTFCDEHGWQIIVGIEPDKPEDLVDFNKLLHPPKMQLLSKKKVEPKPKFSKNAPCPCGSGVKYKKCCIDK